ncbi:hypothetical protein IMSHALPRED_008632 [Imshaugia aleurites]|uniref:Uncharacterized protein n=1 Tax=Imshaugia aleurites TaxID=172621 RepID=A0A8H3FYR2_9LECA|nr:hypothetical protein IMSHALPRED_008632 [Imshaugia aleurites]
MAPNTSLMEVTAVRPEAVRQEAVIPHFRLMDLPKELIDLVYHHALASGVTAILCTSRRVHNEATKILYQSAFFCLCIHYEDVQLPLAKDAWPVTAMPVSTDTMTLIQNIDICVDFSICFEKIGTSHHDLAAFRGANAPIRKTCILRMKGIFNSTTLIGVGIILHAMSDLVNFRRVYVTALSGMFVHMRGSALVVYDGNNRRYYPLTRARNLAVYKLAKRKMEAAFGPSIWHDGKEESDRCLEFRPLEYRKSLRDLM